MSYKLLALGNPLLDIQVAADADLLNKYGLKANDAILVDDKHATLFDEVFANDKKHIVAGGAAQNAARGAAYVLPKDSVVYFGSTGKDKYYETLLAVNEAAGVKSQYMVHEDIPTGKCAVLLTNHDRSLATDLAAANHYKLEHLKENWQFVENAQVFYTGGFHLTVCPPAMDALGKHAAETNKIYITNLSAPFLPQFFKDPMDANAKYWDYLIGNESEALAWAESHGLETKDITEIAKAIALQPKENLKRPRTVIITQGVDPTIVVTADLNTKEVTTKSIPVHPLDSSKIVDSNGAGDAFAGGFLGAITSGESLETAVDQGQWLAALSLQETGPTFPSPKKTYSKA